MRIYDIILKKRNGGELSESEIVFFIKGFTNGEISDYQASALLMAIFFEGMNERETATLTMEMAKSGDMVDLSEIPGIKVDKHSTGGVGDKTSLIIAPIAAACGVPVAKMSGRGLGHTGGTVDKMEAIPGMRTSLSQTEFFDIVKNIGCSIIGQTGNIAPADKKLYALRDVTATVDNLSLIASSVMSKKLAAGSDAVLLDVKTGSGAFVKKLENAIALAREMVMIGENNGRKMLSLVTDMDNPLGHAIGNSLEIIEVCDVLNGRGSEDLTEISIELAANMLYLAEKGGLTECRRLAENALESGAAFNKLCEMVMAQGGDVSYLKNTEKFPTAKVIGELKTSRGGFIGKMNSEAFGTAAVALGAGRKKLGDEIDFAAGIILKKKTGERVEAGESLATLQASDKSQIEEAKVILKDAVEIGETMPAVNPLILARVSKDSIERY